MTEEQAPTTPPRGHSAAVPIVLIAVALVGFLGFQSSQLIRERENLATTKVNQESPIADARKIRLQLDGIAKAASALAASGNVNARNVLADLRKKGIRVKRRRRPAAE